jgi:phosphatidylinositol glycan class Q protein
MFQVYWPLDLLRPESLKGVSAIVLGVPVQNSYVVVNIVTYTDTNELVSGGLINLSRGEWGINIDGSELTIVGYIGAEVPAGPLREFTIENNIICCSDAMIIVFDPPLPNSMQFFTVSPIEISLSKDRCPPQNKYMKLIKQHSRARTMSPQEVHFVESIDMLNKCWVERVSLISRVPDIQRFWEEDSLLKKIWPRFLQSLSHLYVCLSILLRPVTIVIIYIFIFLRHIGIISIHILNTKLSNNLPSLIELSATAQQIDLRLQQFCYFPIQYIRTARQAESSASNIIPKEQYPEYIRFYNTLWLIINDITFGFILSGFLMESPEKVVQFFDTYVVSKLLYSDLNNVLVWLMNSPGGIKLNNELSVFLSDLFRWIIEFWRMSLIQSITAHYGLIIRIISFCSLFGASFGIAVFTDILSITTFHIYCFYVSSAKIYNTQLSVIRSLFRLFCGQKRNILRDRIDSNDYELDQLLLGTLLFTVLSFLLPTVLIFYVTFTITELMILLVAASLQIVMSLLNHFPLFILLLRLKDYKRIPGGIRSSNYKGYIRINIKPISLSDMFAPFNIVLQKSKESYLCGPVLMGILVGMPVYVQRNKLYKLLYSALPQNRLPTNLLLEEIKKTL